MNKKQIRKEIAALINSVKEHSDNIGDKEHIPQLELELILSKIEKLYQKSIVFNYLNSNPAASVQMPGVDPVAEIKASEKPKEVTKTEIKQEPAKPVDLFGSELSEKTKTEKKAEKREENPPVPKVEPVLITQIHKPAIPDIRAAIGINDKFRYANELFNGNIQEYEIAVQQLNTAGTLDSAMEYFMNIQQLYGWDRENECVQGLYDIVERRYI